MVDATKEQTIEHHTTVGEMLAQGHTNGEILDALQITYPIDLKEAKAVLRSVYDSWSSVRVGLNLQTVDDRNWHQHLRMKLLQKALEGDNTPSQVLALRILDSLANIQGVMTTIEQVTPLPIILVDAEVEGEVENGSQ